ncbi:MAG: acyl-CoA dehydrogenase, partial [Geodermatophilaceae bacterium]
MDFEPSDKARAVADRMWDFMRAHVLPAERAYDAWRADNGIHDHPPILEDLKKEARARGLWNLFLREESGLTNLEYASIAEIT